MCGGGPEKPEMTQGEKTMRQIAAKEWDIHKEFFAPMQEQYLENVEAMNSDSFKGDVVAARQGGVHSDNNQQVGAGMTAMAGRGIDPTSKRFDAGSKALAKAAGLNMVNTSTNAIIDTERLALGAKANAVAIGQGKSAQAQDSFMRTAQLESRESNLNSINNMRQDNNNLNAVVQGGGIAAGYFNAPHTSSNGRGFDYDNDATRPGAGASAYSDGLAG